MKFKPLFNVLCYAIFWVWNISFLTVIYAGILPVAGGILIAAAIAGEIPAEFTFTFAALIIVPTICTIVGGMRFSKEPRQLLRLFYGIEAPVFLLCLLRLFVLRELTPASNQIIATLIICISAFAVELFYGYLGGNEKIKDKNQQPLSWVQLICHSLMLLTGLYVGAVLLFYAIPAAWYSLLALISFVIEFFKFNWVGQIESIFIAWGIVWVPIFLILFSFSCTLFIAMPIALATLYIHSGRKILQAFASQYGQNQAAIGSLTAVAVWIGAFLFLQNQPQVQAFSLLNKPPATNQERTALIGNSNRIRTGLLNSYLLSYRYLSTWEENNHIREIYKNAFKIPETNAQVLQDIYNGLMSPFLYRGSSGESEKAEKLYEEFFDKPIQRAEINSIQHALQSTANRDEAKAGLLNINQKKVWLRSQSLTLNPQGDWADVELHEVYENQTPDQLEVFYSFSLPESATMTGLWLGDTSDRAKRFPFVVSPRGAAQQVYNNQVQVRQDPALLEQVGPRHYRLRAFPIPPKRASWDTSTEDTRPTEMHLWLTYKVMKQPNGWALPQLGEKRNIFWTYFTERELNGKKVARSEAWLPDFIPSDQNAPTLHQVNLLKNYRLTAKPLSDKDYTLPQGKRFALILDSSLSMGSHLKELNETFSWLKKQGFAGSQLGNNDADLYVTTSPGAKPQRIDDLRSFEPRQVTFYGTVKLKDMLAQFKQLQGDTAYDGLLFVTDEGSYELSEDTPNVPKPKTEEKIAVSAPLWMVHVGGKLPPAYDDAMLRLIQDSSGGVSTDVSEVLRRVATSAKLGETAVSVVDGYAWLLEQSANGATAAKDGLEPLAARQLVSGLSKEKANNQLTQLDDIHGVAKAYDIVTPYSSMIVLVNDEQRRQLKLAEQQSDRFEREVESGKEQLTKPFNPLNTNVSAVPEPEEWLLIGVIAIALLLIGIRQRQKAY